MTRRKTHDTFLDQMNKISPHILVTGIYQKANTKIKCKCTVCGHNWKAKPAHLLDGHGCPRCKAMKTGQRCVKTHEQFLTELEDLNPAIEILGDYKTAIKNIKCQCKKDGFVWSTKPYSLLKGHGCPKCSESKGEKEIAEILDRLKISYLREKRFPNCRYKYALSFDFFLPEFNACIEYDGKQHFEPIAKFGGLKGLKSNQKRDKIKDLYCQESDINLIRIPYTEENIEAFLTNCLMIESK
jgi:hypothetical protein